MIKSHPTLVAVVGETASGKSALAMQLAQQFDGEIVCADAMTVYKKFDIGTAKPSAEDRATVVHHALDIVDASDSFTVADFQKIALESIHDIAQRGKVPILVGGSGLYVDSILFQYTFRNRADEQYRQMLNSLSLPELHAIVSKKQLAADGVDMQNKRRVIRLIESNGKPAARQPIRENTLVLGISADKEVLAGRIEQRLSHMLRLGLEAEVAELSQLYGWDCEPMRSVGYREWREYFAANQSLQETMCSIQIHTVQLAKKQRTWFRRNKSIQWVADEPAAVVYTTTFLNK